jgi:hypothetical protein
MSSLYPECLPFVHLEANDFEYDSGISGVLERKKREAKPVRLETRIRCYTRLIDLNQVNLHHDVRF